MFRGVTIAGLAVVVLIVLMVWLSAAGGTAALAQQAQPPKGQAQPATQPGQGRLGAAPPGTHGVAGTSQGLRPDQIEKEIPSEEREAMGLAEPTWLAQGKVHPDVRAVLETGQMPWLRFKGYWSDATMGTAYVAVYLRHEQRGERTSNENQAAIKEVQSRVLSNLTAAEFITVYPFKSTPALLGYVNPEGLAKLEKDANVIAVALDDKPLPEEPLPPLREGRRRVGGEAGKGGPSPRPQMIGKVRADVYEALKQSTDGYVNVDVYLSRPAGWRAHPEDIDAIMRKMEDRVLSTLTADEFRLRGRGWGFVGHIDTAGLEKLSKHPDLDGVILLEGFKAIP